MTENTSLNDCICQIELGFVNREATPRLLMRLGIQLSRKTISFEYCILLMYLTLNVLVRPLTAGCARLVYSLWMDEARITSRAIKP
jgi:hypothetical protein